MTELIAFCECQVTNPSGEKTRIKIGVGSPSQEKTGEYGCEVTLPDDSKSRRIFGEDSLQAILLALNLLEQRIDDLVSKNWKFDYEDDGETGTIPFDAYFKSQAVHAKFEAIGEK